MKVNSHFQGIILGLILKKQCHNLFNVNFESRPRGYKICPEHNILTMEAFWILISPEYDIYPANK